MDEVAVDGLAQRNPPEYELKIETWHLFAFSSLINIKINEK